MFRKKLLSRKGFTLVEVLVTTVIGSVLAFGAYQFFGQTIQNLRSSSSSVKKMVRIENFFNQFEQEVINIFYLHNGATKQLSGIPQNGCVEHVSSTVATSLVAWPGHTKSDIENMSSLTAIDSSETSLISSSFNDAITFAYLSSNADHIFVADDVDGNPLPTTGNQPISVEDIGIFEVGDFFVIFDPEKSAIGRITSISSDGSKFIFQKNTSTSIWNQNFPENFGVSSSTGQVFDEGARLLKIHIVTYAYSPTNETIYRYDHKYDDNYNPVNRSFTATSSTKKWISQASNVNLFQIYYAVSDTQEEIRTPRIGTNSEDSSIPNHCKSQLARPFLSKLVVRVDNDLRSIDPEMLRRSLYEQNTLASYERSYTYLPNTSVATWMTSDPGSGWNLGNGNTSPPDNSGGGY